MDRLYTRLSQVCSSFYMQYFPHRKIAGLIDRDLKKYGCKRIVFFGGLADTARMLQERGYRITFVDYTEEMVREAMKTLAGAGFVTSDMRDLKLAEKQDAIILMGRIFTYMHSDEDAVRALQAFRKNLKPGGIVVMDNYATGKIGRGKYFSGTIKAGGITRTSKIARIQKSPALYSWDCAYEEGGKRYQDKNHLLRAFSKGEIRKLVEKAGFSYIRHAQNFEERSFVTIAQKKDNSQNELSKRRIRK